MVTAAVVEIPRQVAVLFFFYTNVEIKAREVISHYAVVVDVQGEQLVHGGVVAPSKAGKARQGSKWRWRREKASCRINKPVAWSTGSSNVGLLIRNERVPSAIRARRRNKKIKQPETHAKRKCRPPSDSSFHPREKRTRHAGGTVACTPMQNSHAK